MNREPLLQTPDFDALARSIGSRRTDQAVRDALIAVWNARGRVDAQLIGDTLSNGVSPTTDVVAARDLQLAITALDIR